MRKGYFSCWRREECLFAAVSIPNFEADEEDEENQLMFEIKKKSGNKGTKESVCCIHGQCVLSATHSRTSDIQTPAMKAVEQDCDIAILREKACPRLYFRRIQSCGGKQGPMLSPPFIAWLSYSMKRITHIKCLGTGSYVLSWPL